MKKNMLFILLLALAFGAFSSLGAQVSITPSSGTSRVTLLYEDFGTVSSDWPVAGWTQLSGIYPTVDGTTTQWYRDDWLNGPSGNNCAKINIYGTTRKGWLVTPAVTIPADGYEIKFDLGLTDYANSNPIEFPNGQQDDRFIVAMSDDPNMTNPTLLREWNNTGSQYVFNEIPHTGTEVTLFLTGVTGTKYFAFYGESTVSATGEDNDLFVDNVLIRDTPTTPQFFINPASVDFGQVLLGHTATQEFLVRNTGIGTLGISSIDMPASPQFTLSDLPTLPTTLDIGEFFTFTATYAPTAEGNHSATISITDDLRRVVNTVEMTGIGFDATITTLPYMQNWDSVTVPNIPVGWSKIVNSTNTGALVATYASSPNSPPNSVRFYNPSDADAQLYL
ncbi:MAG: choice-of-anchor D domain-containing protein, partial [Candidatus Cloacimonetes bacterium]|nr:choice-of-anchor D domain-containing protein [Candidatus Cloacimonadota bacterium]